MDNQGSNPYDNLQDDAEIDMTPQPIEWNREHEGVYQLSNATFAYDGTVAHIDMGGLTIQVTRRYNWFHRWTMRLVFGWRVKNL